MFGWAVIWLGQAAGKTGSGKFLANLAFFARVDGPVAWQRLRRHGPYLLAVAVLAAAVADGLGRLIGLTPLSGLISQLQPPGVVPWRAFALSEAIYRLANGPHEFLNFMLHTTILAEGYRRLPEFRSE